MANNRPLFLELSPSFRERLLRSLRAIIVLVLGIIIICGVLLLDITNTMIQFAGIFVGAIAIFVSLWRILRIATIKLYIDPDKIKYRDRFVWQKISWSDIISIGRANDLETDDHNSVIKKIKSLIILTKNGIKRFDMSSYSLSHGIEIVNKVIDSKPKIDTEENNSED